MGMGGSRGCYLRYLSSTEIIVYVKNIRQERLGIDLLLVHLLHLLGHEDALFGDFLPGAGHAEHPGDPLQEQHLHLGQESGDGDM